MDDFSTYVIEVLLKAKDEASGKIAALKSQLDALKATNDADKSVKNLNKDLDDLGDTADDAALSSRKLREEQAKSIPVTKQVSQAHQDQKKAIDDAASSVENLDDSLGTHLQTTRDVKSATDDAADSSKNLKEKADDLENTYRNLNAAVDRGVVSHDNIIRSYKIVGSEATSLARKIGPLGDEFERVAAISDDAARRIDSREGLSGALERIGSGESLKGLEQIGEHFDDLGFRITGVASFIRGFFDILKLAFAQPLITGVMSLVGSLIAVGSAAAQAGAALAGAFTSGLAQVVPMASIAVAALLRMKDIFQAVSQAKEAEKQHEYEPFQGQIRTLTNQSQLISAQQQLANSNIQLLDAQEQVKASQLELTEARIAAIHNIVDLTLAEKNAQLQAEGASLSLQEARSQLKSAVASGGSEAVKQAELGVKEAELSKKKADIEVPWAEEAARRARRLGVGGAESVISGREGARAAKQAVVEAGQAAEAARRQMRITELTLAQPASKESSQEAALNYLLKQFSAPEKALYEVLRNIQKELDSPNSPLKKVTSYFIAPFSEAAERLQELLHNSAFMGIIDELAQAMGKSLDKYKNQFFGAKGTSFFEEMAHDAKENLPIVTNAIIGIMKLFEDVAKAADPAFKKMSEDWDKFWGKLDSKYATPEGFRKLEEFFTRSVSFAEGFAHLGTAIFDLFKAIGHDAAPQGLATVTSFTGSIKEATEWVQSHGPQVTKFFREAKDGLGQIGSILFTLGRMLISVFSVSSLRAFSTFVNTIILPGFRNVLTVISFITKGFINFLNLFGHAGLVIGEIIGTVIAFGLAFLKVVKYAEKVVEAIGLIWAALKDIEWASLIENPLFIIGAAIGAISLALGIFSDKQKEAKVSTQEANIALENQASILRTIKGLNNEYKSSQLGVEESKLQLTSSEQQLGKSRNEPLNKGESPAEHRVRIEQNEQNVRRAKLSLEERQKEFKELPAKQAETRNEELRKNSEDAGKVAQHKHNVSTHLKELEEEKAAGVEMGLPANSSVYRALTSAIINEKKELQKSGEELAKSTKKSGEIIVESVHLTSQKAPELSKAYGEAYQKFGTAVGTGSTVAREGMQKINKYVEENLQKYGVSKSSIASGVKSISSETTSEQSAASRLGKYLDKLEGHTKGHAAGEYIGARPGGVYRVAEGGHDEVVLTTDPAHASRQRQLLGRYLQKAPHVANFAQGGEIISPTISGGGNLGSLDQSALNTVTGGANRYLRMAQKMAISFKHAMVGSPASSHGVAPTFTGSANIAGIGRYLMARGLTKNQAAGIIGVLIQESSLNPAAVGSEGAIGIAQWLGSRAIGVPSSLSGQLQFLWNELTGSESGSLARIKASKSAQEAAQNFISYFERPEIPVVNQGDLASAIAGMAGGGIIAPHRFIIDSARRILFRHIRDKVLKFASGGIAPWGGQPVPIIAHEGERILNPNQYSHTASLAGMSSHGLDTHLGFNSTPRQHFADGGHVKKHEVIPVIKNKGGTPQAKIPTEELPGLSGYENTFGKGAGAVKTISGAVKKIEKSFKDLKNYSPEVEKYANEIVNFVKELVEHILPQLVKSKEFKKSKTELQNVKKSYLVGAGGKVTLGAGGQAGLEKEINKQLIEESKYIEEEQKIVSDASNKIKSRMAEVKSSKIPKKQKEATLDHLTAEANKLAEKQNELNSAIKSNIEERYSAETTAIQDEVSKLNSAYQVVTQKLSAKQSEAQEKGQYGKLVGISVSIQQEAQKYKTELNQKLGMAEKTGDTELINQIKSEIIAAEQTINHSIMEIASDRLSALTTAFQTKSSERSAGLSIAQGQGQYGIAKSISRELQIATEEQIKTLHEVLKQEESAGNVTTSNQIRQEIASLRTAVSGYAIEQVTDTITAITNAYQVKSTQESSIQSIFQSLGQYAQSRGVSQQLQLLAEELMTALITSLREAETLGNLSLQNQLKEKIASLQSTIVNYSIEQITDTKNIIQEQFESKQVAAQRNQVSSKIAAEEGNYLFAGLFEKAGLERTGSALTSAISEDQSLKKLAESFGDTGEVNKLNDELNKLQGELEENTLALKNSATVNRELYIQATEKEGQFKTGIYSGLSKGLQILGETTGYTNVAGLLGAAHGTESVLGNERSKLEGNAVEVGLGPIQGMNAQELLTWFASPSGQSTISQLESKADEKEKEQIRSLINALITNSDATLENAKEIAKLNGQLNQPQTWNTAASTYFRQAFFNGMGGLLPQVAETLPPGLRPTEMPVYGTQEPILVSEHHTIGNLTLNHPVEKLDPALLGEELNYAIKTQPTM